MLKTIFTRSVRKYAATDISDRFTNRKSLLRFYSLDPRYGHQLGGYEYKEEIDGFRSKWRVPFREREEYWFSKFSLFGSRKFQGDYLKLNPENYKYFSIRSWWESHKRATRVYDQQFNLERLQILGCDLAAAHFIVFRGGAVKFCHNDEWIRDVKKYRKEYDDKLPNHFDPDYVIEAIDLSRMGIEYEGLENIVDLRELKWLSFADCPFFDNWCLDRISGEYGDTLEYLDISYTPVTFHALPAVARFKNLKTLVVTDLTEGVQFFETCAAIKRLKPTLAIEGIPPEVFTPEKEYLTAT